MSCAKFDPKCKGCQPVLVDILTGKPMSEDHPAMKTMMRVWNAASLEEQEAFWRVTVKSSADPADLQTAARMARQVESTPSREAFALS